MAARLRLGLALLVAATTLLPAHPGSAQQGRSTAEDPSARSAGMGGASTAVPWSDDVNGWSNPALLGNARGLRFGWTTSSLVRIAPGVTLRTDRISYGWGGIGLAVESHTLNYGRIVLTDPLGTPIGSYEPTERVRPLSGGISVSRILETLASLRGASPPPLTRYGDVAVGFGRKAVRIRLAPAPYQAEARTTANDFGLLLRATPIPWTDAGRPFCELTYGFAALNHNDAPVVFTGEDRVDYVLRQYRHGIGARFGVPMSRGAAAGLERRFGRWVASGMDPLLSVAVAADFSRYQRGPEVRYGTGTDQVGGELVVANTLAVRLGHVGDEFRGIDGYSFGLGLGFSLADFAGARYDYARGPQGTSLWSIHRHAVAAWFDPVAFVRR